MAMAFAGFLYVHHGAEMASLFLTGYALEEVLSVDNLFVMMAILPGLVCRINTVTASSTGAFWGRLSSAVSLLPLAPVC
jgi:predicted tellurium resistance membrane protein TerC